MTAREIGREAWHIEFNRLVALTTLVYVDKLDMWVPHKSEEIQSPNAPTYARVYPTLSCLQEMKIFIRIYAPVNYRN